MNVDEDSGQNLDRQPRWICQHVLLKEAFSCVKVFRIIPELSILRLTFYGMLNLTDYNSTPLIYFHFL